MKAKNSNPELNYNLNEGKHKKTLLEKYLGHWTGDERVNGSVNLEEEDNDFVEELVEDSEGLYNSSVVEEYKEFLNKFDSISSEASLSELNELIKSKNMDDLHGELLSSKNIADIIKKNKSK